MLLPQWSPLGQQGLGMPELHLRWAYPALLVVMIVVAAGMVIHFGRKGWLGNRKRGLRESEPGEGNRS